MASGAAAIPDMGFDVAVAAFGGPWGISPATPRFADITTTAQLATIAVMNALSVTLLSLESIIGRNPRVGPFTSAQGRRRRRQFGGFDHGAMFQPRCQAEGDKNCVLDAAITSARVEAGGRLRSPTPS
jgi:hypothetical protein